MWIKGQKGILGYYIEIIPKANGNVVGFTQGSPVGTELGNFKDFDRAKEVVNMIVNIIINNDYCKNAKSFHSLCSVFEMPQK